MNMNFKNAQSAFEYLYKETSIKGVDFNGTKALFNVGFTIDNPLDNDIETPNRNWSKEYAEAEWKWYLSGDKNISKLGEIHGKIPKIWKQIAGPFGEVNSNYGYQWKRNDQLDWVINLLRTDPDTRRAAISIYDGKEHFSYAKDTPCTYAIQFTILDNKLNMSVLMRSNDVWFGFCNDQYCFSKLQEMVAKELNIKIGSYFHFAANMHLYKRHLEKL